jgi:hypothetical protein
MTSLSGEINDTKLFAQVFSKLAFVFLLPVKAEGQVGRKADRLARFPLVKDNFHPLLTARLEGDVWEVGDRLELGGGPPKVR